MVIMALPDELCLYDFGRSTKGASKQRRDQINAEIGNMRDLLPLPESARLRLSQLQIMSLSCVYIRKCQLLQKLFGASPFNVNTPFDFFQSLTGFLLVTTRDGKLVYISENVTEYLGHSMVDMKTQGDSIYDIIDKRDHANVQTQLLQSGSTAGQSDLDVTFFCRMNMSRCLKRQTGPGDIKVMHVKGHFVSVPATELSGEKSVFLGLCSPLITPEIKENLIMNNTMVFKSVHSLDMKFLELTETGEHHLKMSNDKAFRESWYGMLHPEDLNEAREKHVQLIRSRHEMGCMMTVRMINTDGAILWVNVVMHVRQGLVPNSNDPVIVCVNQVVSEHEAYHFKIQSQLYSLHAARGPDYFCHSSYPGSASPGLEGEMYMQSYQMQMPGYYPPGMMGYPSPTAPYGNYVSPDQYAATCSYGAPGAGMRGDTAEKRENCARKAEHAQAVEALKRKLGETGPCRTKKVSGMTTTHSNGGYQSSAGNYGCATNGVTASGQGYIVGGVANGYSNPTHSYSYGPSQVMAAPMNGHIPDLCFSMKDKSVDGGVLLAFKTSPAQTDVSRSPGLPPTPDPSPTTKVNCTTIKTEIITETLPDWYLTPEASPGSPKTVVTDEDVSEFAKELEAKIEAEIINSWQKQPVLESRKRKINRDLPVMDYSTVDKFFDFVSGDKLNLRRTLMSQFPSQTTPRKVPKREIPLMNAIDIDDFFRQTSPLGLLAEPMDDASEETRATKTTNTTSPQDQSVSSTYPLQGSPREYNPSSVESGSYLSEEMSGNPDDSRVMMTVSVTLAEPHSVEHSINTSLGLEENEELLHQLFSWVSTAEAQAAPEPNQ